MSAPSIGRIVHFHDRDVGPCAAIITACERKRDSPRGLAVHDENSYDVRVTVFYPGVTKPAHAIVPYGTEADQWSWPPRVP